MAKSKSETPIGVPPDGLPIPGAPEGAEPPPHGTPKKLSERDVAGDLPRVCSPLDRVPAGSKARRYKTRCANYTGHAKSLYVLALDADGARKCHTAAAGIDGYIDTLKASGVKAADIEPPRVVATELAD